MKRAALLMLFLCLALSCLAQKEENDNHFTGNNKPAREAWLRSLAFGMFVHFNVDAQLGITISHSLVGASADYCNRYFNELPKTFDPYKFNAFELAKLAKLAGMKYVVFTAKHHSGFCFWDTKTTGFNILNTPFKRDLLKEYVEGVRKAGLAVGLYYSPEDFKFLYDNNITIKRGDLVFDKNITTKYEELVRKQTSELFTNYGKIDVFFIDGEPKEPSKEVAWKLQPDVVITRGAVNTPEQTLPGVALDRFWESCVTMGTQWNYKPTNDNIKPGGRLIELLIEARAKGGNFLLNVGPHPDGVIPDDQERQLREVAAWTFINNEAIEDVHPWIVTHEDNIWYTASKNQKVVYAFITRQPDWDFGRRKSFRLGSVKATSSTKISVLGQNDRVVEYQNDVDAASRFTQGINGINVSVVRAQRIYDNYKWPNPVVIKLDNVEAAFTPPIITTEKAVATNKGILLKALLGKTNATKNLKLRFDYRPYAGFAENLSSTKWQKTLEISAPHPGGYVFKLPKLRAGKEYEYRAVLIHPSLKIYGDVKRFIN